MKIRIVANNAGIAAAKIDHMGLVLIGEINQPLASEVGANVSGTSSFGVGTSAKMSTKVMT